MNREMFRFARKVSQSVTRCYVNQINPSKPAAQRAEISKNNK